MSKLISSKQTLVAVLLLGLFFVSAHSALAAVAFSDSFETQTFSQWTKVDSGTLGKWTIDKSRYTGKYSALVSGNTGTTDDVLRKSFPTSSYSSTTLSFMYKASGLDIKSSGEYDRFFAEYTVDGINWTVVKEVTALTLPAEQSWEAVSVVVPSDIRFQFRFRAQLSDSGDRVWIDDVKVEGTPKENTLAKCSDKIDNDLDGLVDAKDADCAPYYVELSVVKDGLGIGSVASTPAGISCGLDCVESYLKGAVVTLKKVVARGSAFLGWGGACSGTDDCVVTMTEDTVVTATFDLLPAGMCGNGETEWDEMCDDGNTEAGDGCSTSCQVEANFVCTGAPSQCVSTIVDICPEGTTFFSNGNGSYGVCM